MSWSSWFGGGSSGGSDKPASSDAYNDTSSFQYETVPSIGSSSSYGSSSGGTAEFQQQVQQQMLVAELQRRIGQLSGLCWEKCMTAYPKYSISSREENCVTNCAERYLDVSSLIAEGLAKKFEAS
ncbi:hypothetical protein BOX15_Mlig006824g2 [Macrostomum lignano]|uniref:Mitochondrial import inner membrane translocase subunit n=1 Tax=Macrostomum lignano TaxID=282301 RepID=A0A267GB99_9PLAT|nr:hypothetical protein BOX15_Mlig006824g1 [Macrostomum lignano]PAA74672.1 hypothetical protein BOX15_Mlig005589g1 [Macrostomum lignano]PAA82644.1 hypothetical protein BOX15_Mlig006824g2 [Macrostomum lignano]